MTTMATNTTEHSTNHQEHHQADHAVEQILEWQRQALQPFVNELSYRNQGLVHEISRELADVTKQGSEKHSVSWMDQHEHEPANPADPGYHTRQMNNSEMDIFISYVQAQKHLHENQADHLSGTIMEAVAHRPARALSEHFPNTPDFVSHHQRPDIPDPESYQDLMATAKNYYSESLSQAENYFQRSLQAKDAESLVYAVDTFRTIEKDIEHTATTGHLPSYLEHLGTDEDFFKAYQNRTEALYKLSSQDFQNKYPELRLNPENQEFLQHFRETTKDYLPGDQHSVADYISANWAADTANNLAHTLNSPYHMKDSYVTHREKLYDSLTQRDTNPGE